MTERKHELWKMLAWMAGIAVVLFWIGPAVIGLAYMAFQGGSP
jgi:hypothetical protein